MCNFLSICRFIIIICKNDKKNVETFERNAVNGFI